MKQMRKRLLCLALVLSMVVGLFAGTAAAAPAATASIYDIRVNDLLAPVGLDDPNPTFSWKMDSDAIGAAQKAYAITVTDGTTELWNSGWVEGSDSIGIVYDGAALASATDYTVEVSVKDQTDAVLTAQTTFQTGLMNESDFAGVNWISHTDVQPEISQTTKYAIDFDFTIESGNQGFLFGMKDLRTYVMMQVNTFVDSSKVYLRPHFRTNGTWVTASNMDVTEAIGYSGAELIGKTVHQRIEVDGPYIKTYFGPDAKHLTLANAYTHTEVIPLYNIGFRQNTSSTGGTEICAYDNFVITDGDGKVIYVQDFSGDYNMDGTTSAYAVENGVLKGGSATGGEYVSRLKPHDTNWITTDTEYTIDFDFIIDSYCQGLAFGMKDTGTYVCWQVNGFYDRNGTKVVKIRPHFRENGSWTGHPTHSSNKIAELDVTEAVGGTIDVITGQLIHERLVVSGGNVKTYFAANADENTPTEKMNYAGEYNFADPIPLYNLGFRQNTSSTGGSEIARYDNLVVSNASGAVIYREDFSGDVTLSGSSTWGVEYGMLCAGLTANGENVSMFVPASAGSAQQTNNLPAFRKSFTPAKAVKSAKLFTSGLGVYESYLNGERIGRLLADGTTEYHELKPGFTEMGKRKFYSGYDVTHMLAEGENVLSGLVSGGWWSGVVGHSYGNEDAYWAKLILNYTDGTSEVIATDLTWKSAKESPIQAGTGIFEGERYDATVSLDWMKPGFDDSQWTKVKVNTEFDGELVAWDGEYVTVREDRTRVPEQLYVYDGVTGKASGYHGTVNIVRTYEDGQPITLNPGETLVVDYGQNFAGWDAFEVQGEAGTTVHVEHGELLNDGNGATSRGCDGPEGSVNNSNYRVATADTYYTLSGNGVERYQPGHTYYGFSCAAFTADGPVTLNNIRGQVVTSVKEDTAWMTTSDADVNQLVSNIRWGMYSNYLSIPTDCPQRSERMGWTGDAQNFVEAGAYLGSNKSFLEKYLMDLRDTQRADGRYPGTAPTGSYGGSTYGAVGWADAGIIIPYYLYVVYGDTETIAEHWDSMVLYIDTYLGASEGLGGTLGWGDHVSYESNDDEIKRMLGVSYYAWDALLMARMADALGKTEDVAKYMALYEAEKALYQQMYVNEDGTLKRDVQTVCLYALYLDLLPDEASVEAVSNQLIANIQRNGNKLQTGFLGTEIIMHTLTKIGRTDVAYKLLLQHEAPSWLFAVDQGATTTWESWNAYSLASGLSGSRNSLNHYSFGAVASWMFRGMAGIGYDVENPGFKHIVLAPQPDPSLKDVDAAYESVYGTITSKMSYGENVWNYAFSIPANTTATLYLPVEQIDTLLVDGQSIHARAFDGLTYLGYENGIATFEAVAGSHTFVSNVDYKQSVTMEVETDVSVPLDGAEVRVNGEMAAYGLPCTLSVENGDVITATVKAKNDVDYGVTKWTVDEEIVSEEAQLTWTVNGNSSITAHVGYTGLDNLAKGKTATGNQHNSDWGIKYLTDGILNTLGGTRGWSSSTRGTGSLTFDEYFVSIDLGEKTAFNRLQLYPRNYDITVSEGFPVAYTVYVSDDNAAWTPVYTVENGETPENLYKPVVVTLPETAEGQYVRLGITAVNKLDMKDRAFVQLNELGVYYKEKELLPQTVTVAVDAPASVPLGAVDVRVNGETAATALPATLHVMDDDVITVSVTPSNAVDYAVTGWTMGEETVCEEEVLTYTVAASGTVTGKVEYVGYESISTGAAVTGDHHNSDWNIKYLTDGILNTLGGTRGWSGSSRGTGSLTFAEYFVTLDLGEVKPFNRFQLYPRNYGVSSLEGFPTAYTIYVSNDKESWTPIYTTNNSDLPANLYEPLVIQLTGATKAQYVRLGVTAVNKLDMNKRAFVQLNELGIYYAEDLAEKEIVRVAADAPVDAPMGEAAIRVNGEVVETAIPSMLTVDKGDVITVTAKPANDVDYAVTGWTVSGTGNLGSETIEGESLTYTVEDDVTVTARVEWIGLDSIAVGKPVEAEEIRAEWSAQQLTDGIRNNLGGNKGWSSAKIGQSTTFASEVPAIIDLGEEMTFDRFQLYPRDYTVSAKDLLNYPVNYTLYVSNDKEVWTPVYSVIGAEVPANQYVPQVVQLEDVVSGRYVKLGVTKVTKGDENGNCYVQLSELGVYKTLDVYTVTVANGSGSAVHAPGVTVTVTANAPAEGWVFTGWTAEGVELADASAMTTTFVMPAGNVTVTANYEEDLPKVAYVESTGKGYPTVQEAVDAARELGGAQTIVLQSGTVNEVVTITQIAGHDIVIKGDGETTVFTGTFNIYGGSRAAGAETLTFDGIVFTTDAASHNFIYSSYTDSAKRYAHNVTVQNCSFTGTTANNTVTGVRMTKACYNIVIRDTVAENVFSLAQLKAADQVLVENVTANCSVGALGLLTTPKATVRSSTFTVPADVSGTYGIRMENSGGGAKELIVENATITANIPIHVHRSTAASAVTLTVNGTNTMNIGNAEGYWAAVSSTASYADLAAPTGKVNVNIADAGLDRMGVYPPVLPPVTVAVAGEGEVMAFGGTAAFTVSAQGMQNLKTATLSVALPVEYVTEPVAEGCGSWTVLAQTYENGVLTVVIAENNGVTGDGDLLKITAKSAGVTGEGTVSVTEAVLSADNEGEAVFVQAILDNASMTVTFSGSRYDVNRDGVVNLLDMTRAQRSFGKANEAADVNASGTVDINDLILILQNFT